MTVWLTLCCVLFTFLSGCKSDNILSVLPLKFNKEATQNSSLVGTVAQNSNFRLEWNDEEKDIILFDIKKKQSWSLNPSNSGEEILDEFGMPVKGHPMVQSALSVNYIDAKSGHKVSAVSYNGAVQNGRVIAEKTEKGIKIIYYFDEIDIAIPVEFGLCETGITLSIKTKEIEEGENRLTEISVAPFFCSVENGAKNSYIFIPSGSGAIVEPKVLSSNGETYSQEIYGNDPATEIYDLTSNQKPVNLPVYGAKNENNALCAIVESGAESANIEAIIGGTSYRYSAVYSTLKLRGYAPLRTQAYTGNMIESDYYTDDIVNTVFRVSFSPLYGEDANYSGMAKMYRNYLLGSGFLKGQKQSEDAFSLYLNGGFMSTESFLGIPYKTLTELTTIKQAEKIVEELSNETGKEFSVYLRGFGETGLTVGKLSGNYEINSKLGSLKQLNKLSESSKEKGVSLYFNFDLLRFNKSTNGWSQLFHSAQSANRKNYEPVDYFVTLRNKNPSTAYSLLRREKLFESAEKLFNKTKKWKIEGFGFDTLSNTAYSDYSNGEYYCKKKIVSDVASIIKTTQKIGKRVGVNEANAYAAMCADHIFGAPLISGRFDIFTEDVPFYEIVFKGYVPISSEAINLSGIPQDALLSAVESGCVPTWSLMYSYDISVLDYTSPVLRNGVYSKCKQEIVETVKGLSGYYKAISNTEIKMHKILPSGVRVTEFDNGITVAVNRSDTEKDSPLGKIGAWEYRIGGLAE